MSIKKTKRFKLKRESSRKLKEYLKKIERTKKLQDFHSVASKIKRHGIKRDRGIIESFKNEAFNDFKYFITPDSGFIIIEFPTSFSICTHYSACMKVVGDFVTSCYDYLGGEILLDLSKCQKVDTAALFFLQVVRLDLIEKLQLLQKKLKFIDVLPKIKVRVPKSKDVVRLLMVSGFPVSSEDVKNLNDDSTLVPVHHMGFLKGSSTQKHYLENKKSVFCADIVEYLNSCLDEHGYVFTETETNNIDGIISEVLSNAEDHSGTKHWYITANFSKEMSKVGDEEVGEMNLTIMNFGNSIYEAFLETRDKNSDMFSEVSNYALKMLNANSTFTEEQLFTLATMQEQISRLKYERESRGTGTMKFINSFLELGDFEDHKKGFVPHLSIFTGNVHLICDTQFKPFVKDGVNCLSLNSEQDLNVPPKETHLKKLNQKFPGTLLSVKIYLNKKHLDLKYGGNDHERN